MVSRAQFYIEMIQNISLGLSQLISTFYPRAVRLISKPFVSGYKFLSEQENLNQNLKRKKTIPFARIAKPKYRDIYTDNAIKGGLTPENLACLPRIKIRASTPSDQRNSSHKTIWSYPHRNVGHRRDICFQ
jgi:hypothetical protein